MKEMAIDATIENLDSVLDFIGAQMSEKNISEELLNNIKTAAEEIFDNIAQYAYKPSSGAGSAIIRVDFIDKDVIIEFEDGGVPYNPLEKKNPDITIPAMERSIGGLGIFMAKKIMDTIEYKYKKNKNILTMKKRVSE